MRLNSLAVIYLGYKQENNNSKSSVFLKWTYVKVSKLTEVKYHIKVWAQGIFSLLVRRVQ